jgi:deoxyribonuclease IV
MTMDLVGAHVSIAGGIHNAVDRGMASGCRVIQCFTQNSGTWKGKAVSDEDAALFREKLAKSDLAEVISHDIYLINLASAPGENQEKSLVAFKQELERCARLGINKIVMHPGSHNNDGEPVGIRRICDSFDVLFSQVPQFTGTVLLENTAGQGSNLGYRFEQLRAIIDGSSFPERFGVCFDTCHAFVAGYDLTTPEGYAATWAEFDREIGRDRLKVLHLNDAKKPLGSHVDRHEHLGKGHIGEAGFRQIMNDPALHSRLMLLETPKGDDCAEDRENMAFLRGLIA